MGKLTDVLLYGVVTLLVKGYVGCMPTHRFVLVERLHGLRMGPSCGGGWGVGGGYWRVRVVELRLVLLLEFVNPRRVLGMHVSKHAVIAGIVGCIKTGHGIVTCGRIQRNIEHYMIGFVMGSDGMQSAALQPCSTSQIANI